MGLAKHFEEISERWLENTSEKYDSALSNLIHRFPARSAHAGEVYLNRNGGRMEDIEACMAGSMVKVRVIWEPGTAKPSLECEDDHGVLRSVPMVRNQASLLFKQVGTRRLQVSSAGYVKSYQVYVIQPFEAEKLPDFAELIRSLADNPPNWTDASFETFRRQLRLVLDRPEISPLFIDGLIEYHLGLYHQVRRHPNFRERLQSAYGALRWFIPHSDIARLICTYYLFCANEFRAAAALCTSQVGRLHAAIRFYTETTVHGVDPGPSRLIHRTGLPLLMAYPDVLCIQAIQAVRESRIEDASELVSVARMGTDHQADRERFARLSLLDACLTEQKEGADAARSRFESLALSPWQAIAAAAQSHL